ncbi:MAG: DNA-deoxyinosine glycosylase [Woeseiaceae bacterium]|nr:DNA-deoxyinosine glycosylase [Woeseiaceae bacterium]
MAGSEGRKASAGFPPVAQSDARLLILGSLPGERSIAAQEYYAHPRNAFWRIMEELYGIGGDYEQRCRQLTEQRIALWDVLASSVRPGSLDADIAMDTAQANDFRGFLAGHPEVTRVFFNGRKAEQLFRRFVADTLSDDAPILVGLPSTSPAHAAMPFDKKLGIWRSMLVG